MGRMRILKLGMNSFALCSPKGLATVLYSYSLITVDGVGVLVKGLLVTAHAVVGIDAVAAAAGKEAA